LGCGSSPQTDIRYNIPSPQTNISNILSAQTDIRYNILSPTQTDESTQTSTNTISYATRSIIDIRGITSHRLGSGNGLFAAHYTHAQKP